MVNVGNELTMMHVASLGPPIHVLLYLLLNDKLVITWKIHVIRKYFSCSFSFLYFTL